MSDDTVTISRAYLERLERESRRLDALDAYGVDNWEGYGEALRSLTNEEEEETA